VTRRFDKTHDRPSTFAAMSQLALDEAGGLTFIFLNPNVHNRTSFA